MEHRDGRERRLRIATPHEGHRPIAELGGLRGEFRNALPQLFHVRECEVRVTGAERQRRELKSSGNVARCLVRDPLDILRSPAPSLGRLRIRLQLRQA